jgi:hypothetical protein
MHTLMLVAAVVHVASFQRPVQGEQCTLDCVGILHQLGGNRPYPIRVR